MQSNYPDNLSLLDCCTKNKTEEQLQGKFVVHGNRVLRNKRVLDALESLSLSLSDQILLEEKKNFLFVFL